MDVDVDVDAIAFGGTTHKLPNLDPNTQSHEPIVQHMHLTTYCPPKTQ